MDHDPTTTLDAEAPAVIDLDAARAARNFATKRPVLIRFAGRDLRCAPELPVAFVEAIVQERATEAFRALFTDSADLAHFLAASPSLDDLGVIAEGVAEHYGVHLGNSRRPGG